MKAKEWFTDLAKGTTLGTGILPGVSVGTVGIIVDVYDKLIGAIDGLRRKKTLLPSIATLIPIGGGCLAATFLIMLFWSKVANLHFPFIIVAALAGFVLGAMPIMQHELKGERLDKMDFVRLGVSFLITASIGLISFLCAARVIPLDINLTGAIDDPFHNVWILPLVLFAGFFSAVSCLVPGISGAMVLFILGLYNPILGVFFSTPGHDSIFRDTSRMGGAVVVILALLAGMLAGFLIISHVMKGLLTNYRRKTFTIIIGFVLGSVVSMFINNDMWRAYSDPAIAQWYQFVIGGALFFGIMFLMLHLSLKAVRQKEALEEAAIPETPSEE